MIETCSPVEITYIAQEALDTAICRIKNGLSDLTQPFILAKARAMSYRDVTEYFIVCDWKAMKVGANSAAMALEMVFKVKICFKKLKFC